MSIPARSIYILPTGPGLVFALLVLLMLVGAINYGNNLGFLLCFLLAGLGIVVMIQTWRNLLGLEIRTGKADPVFAQEEACFEIRLRDPQGRYRPGLVLDCERRLIGALDLQAGMGASLTVRIPSKQRGWLKLPRLTLYTRYPLGLLRAWVYLEPSAQCLVYPSPGERLPASELPAYIPSRHGDRGVGADEFIGIRHYRPGDAPKHIVWKALAKEQGLQTKLFGGDRVEQRWLDWYQLSGATEHRLRQLCRGVLDACEQQLEYGLRLPGTEIEPSRGQPHRYACLSALALYGKTA